MPQGESPDVMRLRNAVTGEIVELPVTMDFTENNGTYSVAVTVDARGVGDAGGDFELLDHHHLIAGPHGELIDGEVP